MSSPLKLAVVAGLAAVAGGIVLSKTVKSHQAAAVSVDRAVAEPFPLRPAAAPGGFGRTVIAADPHGQFAARVAVDGYVVPMLVDTGATMVALRNEDARAAGIAIFPSDYRLHAQTASGTVMVAPVRVPRIAVDGVEVRDVEAVVFPPGGAQQSLLGMSFLRKLSGFEVADGRLVLRQ